MPDHTIPALVEVWHDGYLISTDPARLDVDVIHGYLARSYWAAGRPRAVLERSLQQSLCFGLYHEGAQVGMARVVTDYATFAWLCDVFVLEAHRGRGLGVWLIATVVGHPDLQGLRRFLLATRDAHDLYRKHGFAPLAAPERWMERLADQPLRDGGLRRRSPRT
jgi:GNAT superfamily N-acetyltransferase